MLMGFVSVYTSLSACLSGEKEGIQNENAEPLRADGFLICIPSFCHSSVHLFDRNHRGRDIPSHRLLHVVLAAYKKPAIEIRNALTYWSPSFHFL